MYHHHVSPYSGAFGRAIGMTQQHQSSFDDINLTQSGRGIGASFVKKKQLFPTDDVRYNLLNIFHIFIDDIIKSSRMVIIW